MRGWAMFAACIGAIAAAAAPAHATFPGENGKLAVQVTGQPLPGTFFFARGISLVEPDGTGYTELVSTTAGMQTETPVWSPDGSKVAFIATAAPHFHDLFVVNADGSGLMKVADGARFPAWSPDGKTIAYWLRGIWTVPAAGGTPTRILDLRRGDPAEEDGDLYVFGSVDWSPDGQRIAMDLTPLFVFCDEYNECIPSLGPTRIYTVAPDGSDFRPLSDGPADSNASWSPDGAKLVFQHYSRVNVMDADGSDRAEIGESFGLFPVWSPDGRRIAFGSRRGISVMNADGTGVTDILRPIDPGGSNETSFTEPDWQAIRPNAPPTCAEVDADPRVLWPPNKKLRTVTVSGATDPDGDTVTLDITGVSHDEPAAGTLEWRIRDDGTVLLRAARDAGGDGRAYTVTFRVTDQHGATCVGDVVVTVPRHGHG